MAEMTLVSFRLKTRDGYTTIEASWAGGWVMAYAKSVKASPTPLPNLAW